jgi:hypothetical protein
MTTYKGKHIQTVDEVKFILKILLKEVGECPYKQKHIERLREALFGNEVAATAAQILQEEREALL